MYLCQYAPSIRQHRSDPLFYCLKSQRKTDFLQSGKNQSDEQGVNPNFLILLYSRVSKIWIFYHPRFLQNTSVCSSTKVVNDQWSIDIILETRFRAKTI